MKLMGKLAQQRLQEDLGKLDIVPDEGLKMLPAFCPMLPDSGKWKAEWSAYWVSPGSAIKCLGCKKWGPGKVYIGPRTRHWRYSRVFLGGILPFLAG